MKEKNVFEENGKWYFKDVKGNTKYGPFASEEIAQKKYEKFLEVMYNEKPLW